VAVVFLSRLEVQIVLHQRNIQTERVYMKIICIIADMVFSCTECTYLRWAERTQLR